jgi:HEAT repeat protein
MPLIRTESGKTGSKAAAAVDLAAELKNASSDARWAAARNAADRPEAVPLLAEALACEKNERVREAIVTSLARIATAEAASVLLPYLRSDDASLRTGALDGLRAMPELAKLYLQQLLADTDDDVRVLVCDLARDLPGREVPRLLCSLLETEPSSTVCAAAVESLAEIGDASDIASLERCAARFHNDPFLVFSIKVAIERLDSYGDRV